MSQRENFNTGEVSMAGNQQDAKLNGKLDSIEGQLSFMGEGVSPDHDIQQQPSMTEITKDNNHSSLSIFAKKIDENQIETDDLLKNAADLPNGHNQEASDVDSRNKNLDESNNAELLGCKKDDVTSDEIEEKSKTVNNLKDKEIENANDKNKSSTDENDEVENDLNETSPKRKIEKDNHTNSEETSNKEEPDTKKEEDSLKLEMNDSQFITAVSDEEKNKEHNNEEIFKEDENVKETALLTDSTQKEQTKLPDSQQIDVECECTPACHLRMNLLKSYLTNAYTQLEKYAKTNKKQEELTNYLKLLNEIGQIVENQRTEVTEDLLHDAFLNNDSTGVNKKRKPRASKAPMLKIIDETPKKESAEKKSIKRGGGETRTNEPMTENNFKNLQGLAVFAKWPNSGWYYPGIIEGINNSDWREASNVTVTFYDGLMREMKNINILPANLIPATSVLCDLDDETEMIVLSTNRIDNNNVEFSLSTKEGGENKNLVVNFYKLAIRASHMKIIKQQLESNMDVTPKKMHMVSLDNLVSGRRSRIRTHKDDDDENMENTPRKNIRKSMAAAGDAEKLQVTDAPITTPSKVSPNKRAVTTAERSTSKRTATPSKRMKQ